MKAPGGRKRLGLRRLTPKEPSPARRARSVIKVAVVVVALFYFALPKLAGTPKTIRSVGDIRFDWLGLGVALQALALVAYARLMKSGLKNESVSTLQLLRLQLATKAITNTTPGGSAAGASLGYRILVRRGIDPALAGFALASTGLISAIVLNVLFLCALIISLPVFGFRVAYAIAALLALIIISLIVAFGFAIVRRESGAERLLLKLTRRLPHFDPERVAALLRQVAQRSREVLQDGDFVHRAILWATLNWLLDAASLLVFLHAFGAGWNPIGVLVAFGLANVISAIPITPGGIGVTEGALLAFLPPFDINKSIVTLAVPAYRLFQFFAPIPIGAAAYLTLRKDQRPIRLRTASRAAYTEPESRYDWAEEFGHRPIAHNDD